jgi:predicted PurR-regulated permease PerM
MKIKTGFTLQEIFFFFILISLTIAFFNLLKPFITDIFLTVILLILFKRPFLYFNKKFKKSRKTASLVTVFLVLLTIVIPVFFIGLLITNEVSDIYVLAEKNWPNINEQLQTANVQEKLSKLPYIGDILQDIKIEDYQEKINSTVTSITENILSIIQSTFAGLASMLIHTFVVMFLLYYLLLDGEGLIKRLQYLIPLSKEEENELIKNIIKVTDALVFNSFMIGIIEGTFGGILFAILGIPSPVFWGVIMAFLSIIPLVGTNTIMVPMAVFHFIIGETTTGILILSIGSVIILINQNLIRPRLDGNKSGMHTAIMFLASLGGLLWLGIIGFLAGPLVAALFLAIWNQYGIRYQKKLDEISIGTNNTEQNGV